MAPLELYRVWIQKKRFQFEVVEKRRYPLNDRPYQPVLARMFLLKVIEHSGQIRRIRTEKTVVMNLGGLTHQ